MSTCPSHTGKLLKQLLEVSATQLWPHVDVIIKHFRNTLEPNVPRYIQGKFKFHSIYSSILEQSAFKGSYTYYNIPVTHFFVILNPSLSHVMLATPNPPCVTQLVLLLTNNHILKT